MATLPPIVDHGALAGSGGYHRPCSANRGLQVVVDDPGLHDAGQVLRVDLDDRGHPRQIQDDAAVDRVRAAGQPGAGSPGHDRHPELGRDPHGRGHLGLGPRADADLGPADRGPFRLVQR